MNGSHERFEKTDVGVNNRDANRARAAEFASRIPSEIQQILESASRGALLIDRSGVITWANTVIARVTGIHSQALVGMSIYAMMSSDLIDATRALLESGKEIEVPVEGVITGANEIEVGVLITGNLLELHGVELARLMFDYSSAELGPFSELADAEIWFHTLTESSSDIIAVLDRAVKLKYANPAIERILGISAAQGTRVNILDYVHPDDRSRAEEMLIRNTVQSGIHPPTTYRLRTATGDYRMLEIVTTNRLDDPSIRGVIVNARDVTDRYNLTRALRTLSKGNQVMMHAKNEQALLDDMCRAVVESGEYKLAWVGYCQHDENKLILPMAAYGCTDYLSGQKFSWGENEYGIGPGGVAIRTGTAQVVQDMVTLTHFKHWLPSALENGLHSICVLPLKLNEDIIGALAIYSGEVGTFDSSAVALLQELANDLAFGIGLIRDARSLIESEHRFRMLTSVAPIGILEITDGVVRFANARAAEICGKEISEIVGKGWLLDDFSEGEPLLKGSPTNATLPGGVLTSSYRIDRPDGTHRHVRMSVVSSSADTPECYIATIEDITAEVLTQEALVHQAFHDALTGLPNRALFLDRLEQELSRSKRGESDIAVLFLDLDRLKIVNDGLGHEAGDAVLKEVARRFKGIVRSGETAARFSGDEFVFIIRGVNEYQDAVVVAKRILSTLKTPVNYLGNELILSGSVGIVIPDSSSDPRTVIREADTAMYKAKLAGGNTFELFDEELHLRSLERLHMESQLRQAIAAQEFELYFQPKLNPLTSQPIGAEALIRWHHPQRGIVLPNEFISVAEESGLIRQIGNWVIEQAVDQLARWDALEDGPRLQILSVNLSTIQLEDSGLAEVVRRAVESNKIHPPRFAIEVTESTLMATSESTWRSLHDLQKLGILIGIDDFGTGYSSLAYLHNLPVAVVKVDRTFIERLGTSDDSMPIVRAIIDMSHALGLGVVAEGVSDIKIYEKIAPMGFELAQGYYWAPAMPASHFARWWKENSKVDLLGNE